MNINSITIYPAGGMGAIYTHTIGDVLEGHKITEIAYEGSTYFLKTQLGEGRRHVTFMQLSLPDRAVTTRFKMPTLAADI